MAAPVRDWSLMSGERQTAARVEDVKANHRARYEWACDELGPMPNAFGLDLFCGTGYGTRTLAHRTGAVVLGIDGSAESVRFAHQHYLTERTLYAHRVFPFALPHASFDFVTSFESLEHVADDVGMAAMMAESLRRGGRLLLSVPNERKVPHAEFRNPFHIRHYTKDEVLALFPTLRLDAWLGQDIHDWHPGRKVRLPDCDMRLMPETEGQSLVFAFTRVH